MQHLPDGLIYFFRKFFLVWLSRCPGFRLPSYPCRTLETLVNYNSGVRIVRCCREEFIFGVYRVVYMYVESDDWIPARNI